MYRDYVEICTGTRQTEEISLLNDKTLFGRVFVQRDDHRMRPISFALYCARKKYVTSNCRLTLIFTRPLSSK